MKLIELSGKRGKGIYTQIDDEDYERLSKLKIRPVTKSRSTLYASTRIKVDGKLKEVQLHRLLLKVTDPKIFIDHIDRDGLNNQKDNLRICTRSENQMNRPKPIRKDGKNTNSKYKGVHRATNKDGTYSWMSICTKKGYKSHHVRFPTEVEAAIDYNKAALTLHGEFACLNELTIEDELIYNDILIFKQSIKGKSLCAKCNNWLPFDNFYKYTGNKANSNGCTSYCIPCHKEYSKINEKNRAKRCKIKEQNSDKI